MARRGDVKLTPLRARLAIRREQKWLELRLGRDMRLAARTDRVCEPKDWYATREHIAFTRGAIQALAWALRDNAAAPKICLPARPPRRRLSQPTPSKKGRRP